MATPHQPIFSMNLDSRDRRPRWLLWVAAIGVLGIISAVTVMLQGDYPGIERVYRPTRGAIEQAITRRVRSGKGTKLMEFYGGWYVVGEKSYRMEFASLPGTHHVGDTMWVLYDPANPASNITYDHRTKSIHLDRAQIQNVSLDFESVKLFIDSLERARVKR